MSPVLKNPLHPHSPARSRVGVALIGLCLLLGLALSGCQGGEPATPAPQQVTSPAEQQPLQGNLPSAAPATSAPPDVTPTPTACLPPPGWVAYSISPGETFSSLAELANTSIGVLLQGNCKQDPLLIAGETVYLPPQSAAATLLPPEAAVGTPDPCASIFTCANLSQPAFSSAPGAGSDLTYKPCDDGESGPRLTYAGLHKPVPETSQEIGQQLYFFACDFAQPAAINVEIIGPNGRTILDVLDVASLPNPDLIANSSLAQKVIPFYPVCDLPPGDYTLVVQDSVNMTTQIVTLTAPLSQHIMVKPQSVNSGSEFEIYYCNYTALANQPLTLNLYYNSGVLPGGERRFGHFRQFNVLIGPGGWGRQVQTAPAGESRLFYLNDAPGEMGGEEYFWITP